jgi:hypothetical protein
MGRMPSLDAQAIDVLAMDGLGIIGTLGFFVPAALLIALVVGAVVRDRRLSARQAEQGDDDPARTHEALPDPPGTTPPRAD